MVVSIVLACLLVLKSVLCLASCLGLAIVLEKIFVLYKYGIKNPKLYPYTTPMHSADAHPTVSMLEIPGLLYSYLPPSNASAEALESHLLLWKLFLNKRLHWLATLGNNLPFIGLIGTILGIMEAFQVVGVGGSNMGHLIVAVSHSLWFTAWGLVVALPCVLAYNVFQKKIEEQMVFVYYLYSVRSNMAFQSSV
jgi:MotA/TolQ/ExbB proton channel family